jgi:hypothetical protein
MIKLEDLNTKTDKLLYAILQELKKLNEDKQPSENQAEEARQYKCKQCDFSTDNKGLLLAHYRDHKKGATK